MTYTKEQLEEERRYLIEERLSILCGTDTPTPEQVEIAEKEAEQWVKEHSQ